MKTVVDLHIHSKFSRACSKDLEPLNIAAAAAKKGIDIVATGDFTHPQWFEDLRFNLEEAGNGIFEIKKTVLNAASADSRGAAVKTRFILGTELSCIYKHKEKVRRVHHLILAPGFEAAEKLNKELENRGCNLKSDGRPILGITSKDLLKIILEIDEKFEMIPAHAWTPWFAVFGSKSGYDSLEECFEELSPRIHAIETGLSSDPKMNWELPFLDNVLLLSNSDAHSLDKLGREANVFDFEKLDYNEILDVLRFNSAGSMERRTNFLKKFLYTIEFFPEEGKYHCDGHAACKIMLFPEEAKKENLLCPKCKRPLTLGVLHRIKDLAERNPQVKNGNDKAGGVQSRRGAQKIRVPYKSIVPLKEIIANVAGCGAASKKVGALYAKLISEFGSEFAVLIDVSLEGISGVGGRELGEAMSRMRRGDIHIEPGYDGIFGKIYIFDEKSRGNSVPQKSMF